MWFAFFVLWGPWFWILLSVACLLLFIEIENDAAGLATITLIVTLCLLTFFGDFQLFHYLKTYPLYCIGGIAGYFAAGVVWAVPKWYFYVSRRKEEYNHLRDKFYKEHDIDLKKPLPEGEYEGIDFSTRENLNKAVAKYVRNCSTHRYRSYDKKNPRRPDLAEHKSQILTWMTYWPWSMVWTIINDPVRKAFRAIYARISGVFDRITDRIYKDAEEGD